MAHLTGISNMDKHLCLMNNTICIKFKSVFHIVSLWELSFLLKGIQPPSGFLIVSDARETCRGISCVWVLSLP
jgi:hypothetical protein